ncbi:MAG: amidohydrolase family protein [Methanomassiliicoccales archaeon]
MHYVSGLLWTPNGLVKGHIGFQEGRIIEMGREEARENIARGIILPTMVNAHTHIADFLVPFDSSLTLEEIVAPPNGLKHRKLREIPQGKLTEAVRNLANYMLQRGTSRFVDFREGGIRGASVLTQVKNLGAKPVIFGRPSSLEFSKEEMDSLIKIVDGIAVSSISDWDYPTLKDLADYVRKKGKRFALHASERVRENIDLILDLKPSFLVHMTAASDYDLELCAHEGIPVVICPRSNMLFGKIPPISKMIEKGVKIALGTDNAMFVLPDVLQEMEFAARLLRQQGLKDLNGLLKSIIETGREISGISDKVEFSEGEVCDFMVIESKGGDPIADFVFRSTSFDPIAVCIGDNLIVKTQLLGDLGAESDESRV